MKKILLTLLLLISLLLSSCGIGGIGDTQKDAVFADAYAIENAAKLYCAGDTCSLDQELTWDDLLIFVEGLDQDYYDKTYNNGVIAIKIAGEWTIILDPKGTGEWEFKEGFTPSQCNTECVVIDTN